MVFGHGGCAQKQRDGPNMCGPIKAQPECPQRKAPPSGRRPDASTTSRRNNILEARRQVGILADPTLPTISPPHYVYHPFRSLLLSPATLRYHVRSGALSAPNDGNPQWDLWCSMHDGRHSRPWQDTGGTRPVPRQGAPTAAGDGYDPEHRQMPVFSEVCEVPRSGCGFHWHPARPLLSRRSTRQETWESYADF